MYSENANSTDFEPWTKEERAMKFDYSEGLAAYISRFLEEKGWNYSFDQDKGLFDFGIHLSGKIKRLQFLIDVGTNEYLVSAICPLGVEEDDQKTLQAMNEFLTRANYGLKNGNFELSFDDGEIHYKTYVDCGDQMPSTAVIHNSIFCPVMMFRRYESGIVDVCCGNAEPEQAIEKCKSADADHLLSFEELHKALIENSDDPSVKSLLEQLDIGPEQESARTQTEERSEDAEMVKTHLFGFEETED